MIACLHFRMVWLHTVSRMAYLSGWFPVAFPVVLVFLCVLLLWYDLVNECIKELPAIKRISAAKNFDTDAIIMTPKRQLLVQKHVKRHINC